MLKTYVLILLAMIIAFFIYISDKPIIKGGTMIGKMHVNGTAITQEKSELRDLTQSNSLYVISLPAETAQYLQSLSFLEDDYESNKKFIMYTRELNGSVNCPYGRIFQEAFLNARENESNHDYYSFHTLPEYQPYMKQKDIDRLKQNNIKLPEDLMSEEDAMKLIDLHQSCSIFCIVNPENNHVITFSGVGKNEANSLQTLLDYVKDKNF